MARPIKETPILYGEEARKFEESMKQVRPLSDEKLAQIKRDYDCILSAQIKRDYDCILSIFEEDGAMEQTLNITDYRVRPLEEGERVKSFDCGDDDLNDFILNAAHLYREELLTHVLLSSI